MSEANKAVVRGVYAAINAGNLDAMAAAMAENVVEHEGMPGFPPTKAGILQFFAAMRQSFSGFTFTVHDVIAEGDKVAVRANMSGTHVGEFMGMPATNKKVDVPVADYFRLENGKVAEHWGTTDSGVMMEQLGGS